jgi:Na+/melibiose symporter-like transporter
MSAESHKLALTEKIGYSLGDLAANFVFQTQIMFLSYFYTEVFGITAAAMGTLMFITRIWHAVIDPMMGAIADRTNTRWGKFRPWVLWTAIPFGILFVLTYTTPDLDSRGKVVWAYVTYILLMLVYTINNIPYSAMTGVLTGDSIERTSLAQWRFIAAMTAALLVQTFTPILVEKFGGDNQQLGYQLTVGMWAVIAVLAFFICFATTKERVQPNPNQSTSIKQDLLDLVSNGPWWALSLLTLFIFINLAMRGSTTMYYFTYVVDGNQFVDWINSLQSRYAMKTQHLVSWFNFLGIGTTLVGVILSKPLAMRFGKRNTFLVCLFFSACFILAFVALPRTAVGAILICQMLYNLSYGPTIPLLWAMMADVADYGEWTNGRRATGMVFATMMFALNTGLAIGGAITGWMLSWYGYVEKASEQTAEALRGILWLMSVYPATAFFLGVAALFLYKIDKRIEHTIATELTARREQFVSTENV